MPIRTTRGYRTRLTAPVSVKTEFDPVADQPQAARLLQEGWQARG
jgi:hypothetical protein